MTVTRVTNAQSVARYLKVKEQSSYTKTFDTYMSLYAPEQSASTGEKGTASKVIVVALPMWATNKVLC